MKITKQQLKRIIKEELEGLGAEDKGVHDWWIEDMKKIMEEAHELYEKMPPIGKENFTKNFEMYAGRWRDEMQNRIDSEWTTSDDEEFEL